MLSLFFQTDAVRTKEKHDFCAGPRAGPDHRMLKQSLRDILARHPALAGETWLECLTLRQEEDILRVGFPHKYFALWFGQHKQALFEEVCKRCFTAGNNPAIVYEAARGAAITPFYFAGAAVRAKVSFYAPWPPCSAESGAKPE